MVEETSQEWSGQLDVERMQSVLATIFEDIPDAILFADPGRRISLVNPAVERMFGYRPEELIGLPSRTLYADADTYELQGKLRFHAAAGEEAQHYEVEYRRKDGETFPAETVAVVIRNRSGEVAGYLGILRDVSRRKQLEEERESARQRLNQALEALYEGVLLFDSDERLIAYNSRFREIYPIAARSLAIGRTYAEMLREAVRSGQFVVARDEEEEWIRTRVAGFRDPPADPVETRLADGRWTLVSKRRTSLGDTVTSYVEITRRKRLEEALTRLNLITSTRTLDHEAKVKAALELGAGHFGLPIGIVSRIEGDSYEVLYATSPGDAIAPGTRFPLGRTYCAHTLAAEGPTGFHHAGQSAIADHPCYQDFGLEAYLGVPLLVDGARYGTLNFSSPDARDRPFDGTDGRFIELLADWIGNELARLSEERERYRLEAELRRLAMTDELTGASNRRAFLEAGTEAFERSRRYARPLSVLMADLDHFKAVNDTYGHDGGDEVLREFVARVRRSLRTVDILARLGGEEFAILLPETDEDGALRAATRILSSVRSQPFPFRGTDIRVTSSIGISGIAASDTAFQQMLTRSDAALYEAKTQGRDRARVASLPT